MGKLIREAKNLLSRKIRDTQTGGQIMRVLDQNGSLSTPEGATIWDWVKKQAGWACQQLMNAAFGNLSGDTRQWFSQQVDRLKRLKDYWMNFDFAQTDKEIDEKIKQMDKQIRIRIGTMAGRTVGTLLASVPTVAVAFTVNVSLGWYLLETAGIEIVQDYVQEIAAQIRGIREIKKQQATLEMFKNGRFFLKKIITNPNIAKLLPKPIVEKAQKWGETKKQPWTLAGKYQEWLESLPEELEDVVEEFFEEMDDAMWETGYTLANSLDEFFFSEAMRDIPGQVSGKERTIVLLPNRENKEEKLILRGSQETLKTTVTQTLATRDLLENRDSGLSLIDPQGQDIPIITNDGIKVIFILYNYESPPYWTKERRKKIVKSEITLPNFKRGALTWENIKTIFGTNIVLTKGSIEAVANLVNGRKIVAWVSSEVEGEKLLDKLVTLVTPDVIYPYEFNKRKGKGKDKTVDFRKSTPMYLSSMTIVNYDKLTKYEAFKLSLPPDGKIPFKDPKREKVKIPLHYEQKPKWIDEQIKKALSNSLDADN